MVAIDERISGCEQEFEEVRKIIVRGSDEHLDFLIAVRSALDALTAKLDIVIGGLIKDVNGLSDEDVVKSMPGLFDLYSTSISLVATLKRSSVSKDLKSHCLNYFIQVDNLREFIYDIERLRLSDDEDMNQIFSDINAL